MSAPSPDEYDEDGDPYEIRICDICGEIIGEDDPGVPATTGDGDDAVVCTRHLEEIGRLHYDYDRDH